MQTSKSSATDRVARASRSTPGITAGATTAAATGTAGTTTATAALALSMLIASLGTSIANIALPTLAEAWGAPFAAVQGVVVAYLAALTISVVAVGRLGDVYGLRRMHLVGLGLFAAASLACGLAPDLAILIAARAIQGIGAAFLMTLSMALMRQTAGDGRIGRAMGLLGTVSAIGTALGPSLGGVLIATVGWRAIFLIQAPLAGLAFVLAFGALPRRAGGEPAASWGETGTLVRALAPNLVVNLMVAAVMMTTLVVGPFYLSLGLGLGDMLVGAVMSVGPVISIAAGVPAGRAVDAFGARRVLGIGLVLLAAGALLLALLPQGLGVAGYVVAIVVLTPGYQLFQAANNTAVMADVAGDRRGMVSGLLTLARNLGLVAGASGMAALFAFGAGTGDLGHAAPAALATGMRLCFLLAAGSMVVAIVILFGRRAWRPGHGRG